MISDLFFMNYWNEFVTRSPKVVTRSLKVTGGFETIFEFLYFLHFGTKHCFSNNGDISGALFNWESSILKPHWFSTISTLFLNFYIYLILKNPVIFECVIVSKISINGAFSIHRHFMSRTSFVINTWVTIIISSWEIGRRAISSDGYCQKH